MAFDIWFGQFNTVRGAVQEEGPYVGIFEGGMEEPDGVAVYVVVEPCGSASADLCASTIEAVARGFGEPNQPLTACLLRALNAAHTYVRRHHPGEVDPAFGVGITVLATRRGEAYVVQAGPSLACVRSGGAVRILEPLGDAAVQPVGSGPRVTPSFARLELQPGDAAILLFSSGADLVDRRRLPQLVSQPPEHALPELYLRSRGASEFAALYIAVLGERRMGAPGAGASVGGSRWPESGGSRRSAAAVSETAPTGTETLVVEDETLSAEHRNGHASAASGMVRTVTPRRTPLGSMAPPALPITRRHVAIGAAVIAVGLLLLLLLPMLARQGKNEKFNQLLRGADEAIVAAEKEADLGSRRTLLERAQATIDEARALRPVEPAELAGLEQRMATQLAELDGVRELSDLVQVADLSAPGLAAPSATQIAIGPSIYVLDATVGKVLALPRQGEPRATTVFEEGRPAGADRTGRARAMAWWAAEGDRAGSLLVLDDQRRLYAVDEGGGIRSVALGDTDQWKSDTAIAMGANNLYVLDATGNQLWRYALNAGGFPGSPEPMLNQRAVVRDATGLSIAAGGPILTTPDGRLLRVGDGREQVLQTVAIDRPLLAPGPPILNAGDGLLYVPDRGNQRIARLGTDGTFRGQLTHHRLAGLQAIALDEAQGTLYAIAGQSLVKATIPK